ncbi:MAG: intein-containing replicative DNA helicase, partial [Gammaproteobacteria bacterium]|nr:intein-containing replicative DNA helicase [Gammaproteobacteria bacterium]
FSLPTTQIALLLRHLWATDGTIAVRRPGQRAHTVSFATCSRRLADDVAALLLRLGIASRTHTVKVGHYRPVYSVSVSGTACQRAFLEQVGAFGPRCEAAAELAEALGKARQGAHLDVMESFAATSVQAMGGAAGRAAGAAPVRGYAEASDPYELEQPVSGDVLWDRIVAITADGEAEVFDLTVPGPACWLADGLVSHNSGALEQDSDMILLIYREEVYDRNTTRKGIAEIDLVKHRNGEIGTFLLTFQGQYTRFANYVSDSYAEGVLR